VLVGVLLSGFFFAHKVGRILHIRSPPRTKAASAATQSAARCSSPRPTLRRRLRLQGGDRQGASSTSARAHFWDITAVSALDKVVVKFRREGTDVEVVGLNEASATMVDKFAVHDKDGADDLLMGH
jgi:SulP family sulfate permease